MSTPNQTSKAIGSIESIDSKHSDAISKRKRNGVKYVNITYKHIYIYTTSNKLYYLAQFDSLQFLPMLHEDQLVNTLANSVHK